MKNIFLTACFAALALSGFAQDCTECTFYNLRRGDKNLVGATFTSDVRGDEVSGVNFTKAKFSNINFHNCTLTDCIFNEADATMLSFSDCKLINCSFVKSNLVKAKFSNTTLISCDFTESTSLEMSVLECVVDGTPGAPTTFKEAVVNNPAWSKTTFSAHVSLEATSINGGHVYDCVLTKTNLKELVFNPYNSDNPHISGTTFRQCILDEVFFGQVLWGGGV